MVTGVETGFEKKLIMIGVGYKGEVNGKKLILNLGYDTKQTNKSHNNDS